jgi:hypothetical protein
MCQVLGGEFDEDNIVCIFQNGTLCKNYTKKDIQDCATRDKSISRED